MSEGTVPIRPYRGLFDLGFTDLWRHRELLFFLTWRDIKIRYKQTAFGAAWAVLQPLLLMVVFSVVLGRFAKVPSDGLPYPLFAFAGLVPWTLFSQAVVGASNSLVDSPDLLSKVYFPRVLMPLASGASYLIDLPVAVVLLAGMMWHFHVHVRIWMLTTPLFALGVLVCALAVGVWLAAVNVRYRDVRYVVPFLVQLWLFATPVAYPSTLAPERFRPLIGLNPVAGLVEGFRWSLVGGTPPTAMLAISLSVTAVALFAGIVYFRRAELSFADWI